MADEKGFFRRREVGGRTLRMFKEQITDAPRGELFELQQQGGGEVEGRTGLRKLFEHEGHIIVGLRGMQADPGHTRGPGERVRVIRLMHMPEKAELYGFHREVSCRLTGSMS